MRHNDKRRVLEPSKRTLFLILTCDIYINIIVINNESAGNNMVGRKKNGKMTYTMSVTSAGQVTIPKEIREALGITDSVEVEMKGNEVIMTRAKTAREIMAEIHATFTPEMKARIKANAGKTVNQLREEMERTPEGRKYIEEFYGA